MNAAFPCAIALSLAVTAVTRVSAQDSTQGKNPPGVNPQHYQCYNAVARPMKQRRVELQDQFGRTVKLIGNPVLLCNTVSKNRQESRDTTTHLVCYQVVAQKTPRRLVTVLNQFGVDTLRVDVARLLCVPSIKEFAKG
jgi:hypothetical protein